VYRLNQRQGLEKPVGRWIFRKRNRFIQIGTALEGEISVAESVKALDKAKKPELGSPSLSSTYDSAALDLLSFHPFKASSQKLLRINGLQVELDNITLEK